MQVMRPKAKDQEDREAQIHRKRNEEEITFMQREDNPRSECVQNVFMHQGYNTTTKFKEGQKQVGYLRCAFSVFLVGVVLMISNGSWCGKIKMTKPNVNTKFESQPRQNISRVVT